jgi:quercetin dioxygenase-like cupin family protein
MDLSHPAVRPLAAPRFDLKETAMLNFTTKIAAAAIAAAAFAGATPALAGQCTMPGTNALDGAPTMPKDVTDTVIASVDLGPEIGVDGRKLRTRRLVVQPGGIVPIHSHKDRPALIYTLSGSITEYSTTCSAPIEHEAGDISREADGLSHYWVNHGKVPTVLLSSDVYHGK